MAKADTDLWQEWWTARVAAIETVLGPSDDIVGHATLPFQIGADLGGAADIIYFRKHVPGVIAVTSELIGCDEQIKNALGNYELMICQRDDVEWGADIISRLAYYTLRAKLEPSETMDIGEAAPDGSTITAFLFCDYGRFKVRRRQAGLLLCLGITADELAACHNGKTDKVLSAIKAEGVFPFTDLNRKSVLSRKRA
jgi:hypothetical protein